MPWPVAAPAGRSTLARATVLPSPLCASTAATPGERLRRLSDAGNQSVGLVLRGQQEAGRGQSASAVRSPGPASLRAAAKRGEISAMGEPVADVGHCRAGLVPGAQRRRGASASAG